MARRGKGTGSRAANGRPDEAERPSGGVSTEEGTGQPSATGLDGVAEDGRTTAGGSAGGRVAGAPGVAEAGPEVEVIERHVSPRALLAELVPEFALLLAAIYLFVIAGNFAGQEEGQLGPAFWPRMAAVGLSIALVVRMVQTVRSRNRPIVKVHTEFDEFEEEPVDTNWGRLALGMALAVAYVFATMFLGYLFATALFLLAFIWLGGQRKWFVPVIAGVGALVLTYAFIGIVFVSLPSGVGIFDTITVAIYQLLGIQ